MHMAASPTDRNLPPMLSPFMVPMQSPQMLVPDSYAKDAVVAWFKGEFAAANAIIDALLNHVGQLSGGSDYDALFDAIHRRRLNWIPVIQMQKYHSIADVVVELRRLAANKVGEFKEEDVSGLGEKTGDDVENCLDEREKTDGKTTRTIGSSDDDAAQEDDSPESDVTDSGSQDAPATNSVNIKLCANHEACGTRTAQIKLIKGFNAKELVKGHYVNVVKGLKLYEDIFTDAELGKLTDLANELHAAGKNGELSGETFVLFNKEMKGIKRELIQLGVPIFGPIVKEEAKANIDPIPTLLQDVIDHLIQWQLIPEYKRPNGCIINFFQEDEYSQPFLKPPHLDQPVSTLLLSESTMAYGRTLAFDDDGDYKGALMLSLNKGSVLVMRGNSVDMARHVMCPSPSRRISVTFFRVRPEANQCMSPTKSTANAITLWQQSTQSPHAMINAASNGFEGMETMPKWGIVRAPMVMLSPVRPMVLSPRKLPCGGTGVFLPWNVPSKKYARHLPPRAQRGRLLGLPAPVETHMAESTSCTSNVE